MAYTLTVQDNAVYIVNTLGYNATVQGFARCEARIPSAGAAAQGVKTWIVISDDSGFVVQIASDDFSTIGGVAPAGTVQGIVLQVNALFKSAYPSSGGAGSGSFNSGTATAGTTYTNAALVGKTVVAIIVNNSVNNANFTFNSGTGTVTLTGGYTFANGDAVVVLYTS